MFNQACNELGNEIVTILGFIDPGKIPSDIIKQEITKGAYKFAAAMLKKPFRNVKGFLDSDEICGAPFIGLKSLVVKAHGSSNAKAIKNAVRQCVVFTDADIIGKIKDKL